MKRLLSVIVLFLACGKYLRAQDTASLIRIMNGNGSAVEKCIASQKLAQNYSRNRPDSAIAWAERGLPFARQAGIDSLLWKQYDLLADLYDNASCYDESISLMRQSLTLKEAANNTAQTANTWDALGVVYGEQAEYVKQTDCYIKAQKNYELIGDKKNALAVACNLANVYGRQKNYTGSIDAYRQLLPQLREQQMMRSLMQAYCNMSIFFMELKQVDSCFHYSALEITAAQAGRDFEALYHVWERHAAFCAAAGRLQTYKPALDSMMHYALLLHSDDKMAGAYEQLATYHLDVTRDNRQALDYFLKALAAGRAVGDKPFLISNYSELATTYARLGDYSKAYQSLQQAYALKDSVVSEAGQKQVAEMQARFGAEKKEAQIKLLDRENNLQQRTAYFLLSGLGLLAIAGFSLFRSNRTKQRSNRRLQVMNGALDEANQSKVKLFSILSHDLRSPVSDLFSYLQLQKMAPHLFTEEKKKAKQDQLYESTDHLLNTMEDLLLWSKSQLESFVPEETVISLRSLAENTAAIYRHSIAEKNIALTFADADCTCHTDENMLKTIVRNFMNNAVKFTPEGGRIHIAIAQKDAGCTMQLFNSGRPMSIEAADQLFNWSGMNSSRNGYGLKLSKALADKLGLTLTAIPQADGNLFTITFPAASRQL